MTDDARRAPVLRRHRREVVRVAVRWLDGHEPDKPDTWTGRTLIPPVEGITNREDRNGS